MSPGSFVWYDLATTDPEAASRFYADVIGWTIEPIPELHYTILKMGEARAAGLMELPQNLREAGVPPHWNGYIAVSDVDDMVKKVQAEGGQLKFGPEDIPNVGRVAGVLDPGGAFFYLFKGLGEPPPGPGMMSPGHVGWNELRARDGTSGFEFYSKLFGWTRGNAMNMGPMGAYQMFGYEGMDHGGIMTAPDGMHPNWLFYLVVDGLDAAVARVEAGGGKVTNGPMEVPGGAWIINGRDPQGGNFALVSAKR